MPALDLSALPPLPIRVESKTLTDPRAPGASWTFTFGFSDCASHVDDMALRDRHERLTRKYIDDDAPILAPGGGRIPVSGLLLGYVAMFQQAEEMSGSLDITPAPDLIILARTAPSAWSELCAWYVKTDRRIKGLPETAPDDAADEPAAGGPSKNA